MRESHGLMLLFYRLYAYWRFRIPFYQLLQYFVSTNLFDDTIHLPFCVSAISAGSKQIVFLAGLVG